MCCLVTTCLLSPLVSAARAARAARAPTTSRASLHEHHDAPTTSHGQHNTCPPKSGCKFHTQAHSSPHRARRRARTRQHTQMHQRPMQMRAQLAALSSWITSGTLATARVRDRGQDNAKLLDTITRRRKIMTSNRVASAARAQVAAKFNIQPSTGTDCAPVPINYHIRPRTH